MSEGVGLVQQGKSKRGSQPRISILDPVSVKAQTLIMGRKAFLREVFIAILLSLPLPLIVQADSHLNPQRTEFSDFSFAGIIVAWIICFPIARYASLRLNAATLAREMTVNRDNQQPIVPSIRWPIWFSTIVPKSLVSRIIAGLPYSIFFIAALAMAGALPVLVVLIIIILLMTQIFLILMLLR